jgi:apolipoprotein N-acyltransferase
MNMHLWRRLLPVGLGAAAALGQAPFNLPLVLLVALAVAVHFSTRARIPRAAAAFGWALGFGYFAVSLHWIVSPFLVDAARHGWMAPFAVVLIAAGGGVFWGVAFWAARRMSAGPWPLVPCWAAVELSRAYIFTGFPWAAPAQSMVDAQAGQMLAWIGPHGLNLVIFAVVVALSRLPAWGRAARISVVLPVVAVVLSPPLAAPAPLSPTVLRLVQPNAPQNEKWDPDKIGIFYARQLELTSAAADSVPDAVIWPETAIPWNLIYADTILQEISAAAAGVPVILGVQRTEGARHFNTLIALGPLGEVTHMYDKHHLVPFGEYMPLGDFAARFGIYGLAPQHGAGFSAGPGARLMDLGPLGRALPLICYEAVFAHDVNAAPSRPDFIIHATNDAWFGTHAGPQQHLAQARMRAIEQGLPVARAANTGISAMIDPQGRLLQSIGLGQAGFIDATLPRAAVPTFYSRTGDLPLAIMLALILAAVVAQRRRTRVRQRLT